jgi:hypothetical protein
MYRPPCRDQGKLVHHRGDLGMNDDARLLRHKVGLEPEGPSQPLDGRSWVTIAKYGNEDTGRQGKPPGAFGTGRADE